METTAKPVAVGKATIWGIDRGQTIAGYIGIPSSDKFTHKAKMAEVTDGQGFDAQLSWVNEYIEFDAEFKPSGASRAAAKSDLEFIAPGSAVVVAGITVGPQDAPASGTPDRGLNGKYLYVGDATIDLKAGDNASVTLKLRKYVDPDQNDALCTAVVEA